MYEIWTIARNDIRKTLRSGSTYFPLIIMVAASISYILGYNGIIKDLINQGTTSQVIYEASRSYMNNLFFLWPLAYCMMVGGIGSNALVLEKVGRNFEPLMVTPLSIRQIWAGKSLGMSVVSVIIGLSLFLLVFLGMSLVEVIPKTGVFVVPDVMPIITAVVLVPVLVLGVILLVTCIQLIMANPRTAGLVFVFALVGIWIGVTFATFFVKNTNYFAPIYLGLIVIIGIVIYFVLRYLTPEKVTLSSKG